MARVNEPIEPVTLANMRANGVRSLAVSSPDQSYCADGLNACGRAYP
jgi:hypothetical protein